MLLYKGSGIDNIVVAVNKMEWWDEVKESRFDKKRTKNVFEKLWIF